MTYAQSQIEAGVVYHVSHGKTPDVSNIDRVWGVGASYKFSDRGRIGVTVTQQKNALNHVGNDANTYAVQGIFPMQQ